MQPVFPDFKFMINALNRDLEKSIFGKIPFVIPKSYTVVLGRLGNLEIRLAQTQKEIKQAQKLRYRIFYKEQGAIATLEAMMKQRDIDPYDAYCDHLLVVDTKYPRKKVPGVKQLYKEKVVGTYRLLPQHIALQHSGFYSQAEFDVDALIQRHPGKRFLELGRSCVDSAYRDKRTIELLWRGIWWYVQELKIDALFGCASFAGTDVKKLSAQLTFLQDAASAAPEWQTQAHHSDFGTADRVTGYDAKQVLHQLPTLIKGYMRCGARFGTGAVIDREFNTTDVLVVLPVSDITPRYREHFTMQ
jgi:L-ornithine Nalpha-acyltransferase